MAGLFDDLIPQGGTATVDSGGLFDDLIPNSEPPADHSDKVNPGIADHIAAYLRQQPTDAQNADLQKMGVDTSRPEDLYKPEEHPTAEATAQFAIDHANTSFIPPDVIKAGLWANPTTALPMAVNRLAAPNAEKGIEQGVSEAISGLATPANIGLIAATGDLGEAGVVGKIGSTALAAYFEAQAVRAFPDEYKRFQETKDSQEKWHLGVQMASSLGLPITAAFHGGGEKKVEAPTPAKAPEPPPVQRVSPETGQVFAIDPKTGEVIEPVPTPDAQTRQIAESPASTTAGDIAAGQRPAAPAPEGAGNGVGPGPEISAASEAERQGAPAGTSNRIFQEVHGDESVPSGTGVDTGELLDSARAAIRSGDIDPYSVLSKTRAKGIANSEEYATLAAEHERLVNDAVSKQKAGTPDAEEAAQRANDFANAIQPHKTAASDLMRLFQGDLNYDLSTPFGIDQYMKAELGRNMKPSERPLYNKRAQGIRQAETDAQAAVSRSDARVQRHYGRVRDIPMEEAASRVREWLKDCQI